MSVNLNESALQNFVTLWNGKFSKPYHSVSHPLMKRVVFRRGPVLMLCYALLSCLPALAHAVSDSLLRVFELSVLFTLEKTIFTAMKVNAVALQLDNL